MAPYEELDIETISEPGAFLAWGYSRLKVRRGDHTLVVRVRIESVAQDLVESLRKAAPRPPQKTIMLDPQSEDGRRLGVTTRQKAIVPDFTDPQYLEALEAHNLRFTREIVGRGVASKLTLRDGGSVAQTSEEKYQALTERGLSGAHFTELVQDILNLTAWTEDERENFLTRPSASGRDRSVSG